MNSHYDPEEQIICPYNASHYIRRCRMNTHLVKCKKSYPESKLVECDFNVNHKISEPELQYHHENCPDRKKIEVKVYQEEGTVINKYPIAGAIAATSLNTEESWDNDNVPSYDPQKYCEESEVLRKLDVASAADRKNFRVNERMRVNQLSNNKPQDRSYERNDLNMEKNTPKRNLPETTRVVVEETTPASVEDILKRIKIGKNKPFVPADK